MRAIKVGGVADRVHLLVSLPSTLSVAKAVQLMKGNSSKWIHETFPEQRDYRWQEGYGAFSVGVSGQDATIAYIENQDEHHRRKTFDEELKAILKRYSIEYEDWILE